METKKLSPVGQVVKRIMMALSDFPENVELTEISGGQSTILEVSVRKSDHGKILGRGGRNVNAVREILACHSGLQKHRYILEVLEGEREGVTPRSPFSTHPSHTEDSVANTAELLIEILMGIVDDGPSVQVNPVDGLQVAVFEVRVAPDDNRRVIGRGGRVATALRELLMSMGRREGRKFLMEVVESGDPVNRTSVRAAPLGK